MKHLVRALLAALSLLSLLAIPAAAAPRVVASILPVQSLVAGVMQGIGKPHLLVEGASSPHDFTLSPSSARALQSADAVFWVGPNVESFLVKPPCRARRRWWRWPRICAC